MSDTIKFRPLVTPTVTLHGSDQISLVADLVAAVQALRKVEDALGVANPHGRDYRDWEEWKLARDAWHDRRWAIATMRSEMEEMAYDIIDGNTTVEDRTIKPTREDHL
jgi:hypothetical protein